MLTEEGSGPNQETMGGEITAGGRGLAVEIGLEAEIDVWGIDQEVVEVEGIGLDQERVEGIGPEVEIEVEEIDLEAEIAEGRDQEVGGIDRNQ